MKKLSLLIALCTLLTIGGVYATWTYTASNDVADETIHMAMNLGGVAFEGTYGSYEIDESAIKMTIDPKATTTHTTALYATGHVVIKFTPHTNAPQEVKNNAVASTYSLSVSNADWKYNTQNIVTVDNEAQTIVWTNNGDGTFSCTIPAADIASLITLTEFNLDTKTAYDTYNSVLTQGTINITVSDGIVS